MKRAIVFAYHQVGVRCLKVLLDAGVRVDLVVTHRDQPGENIWFDSVAALAQEHGIDCIAPDDANAPEVLARGAALQPDFVFSFYFRQMLKEPWLLLPRLGAWNMHGSLLPQFRGRVPVNWAVIEGARATGATLHAMEIKPDAGAIAGQFAVPILGDDTAAEVFAKVVVASELVLVRALPGLLGGTAVLSPQRLSDGRYYGGRKPEDGRIPADGSAQRIHDLVRALAPPYPPAFLDIAGRRVFIERSLRAAGLPQLPGQGLRLACHEGRLWLLAGDGSLLRILRATVDGQLLDPALFLSLFGSAIVAADTSAAPSPIC
ncbi:formyltransferase [Xylophilus rhododendri]|uniref:Formyltransferase n=1 Tax=Xylophilus rhododendri TaxID=2697032 RepID=A0A857JBI6_9BURK|nr:formyltransferase [Xylophilus rhododendri]QHJ00333.1 formyltransferase [Xylophilus rhododendri]